ncbi:type II toxin-antitoxin system HicB family antitoxin [Roseiconus lacunae]|uniref:hypothetical protein n=1 Tax=Roseiconus lacunae TaxID=2605694 RepID=UPI0011F0DBFE|nr:hypothetical protein [Roseiconus lacunae]
MNQVPISFASARDQAVDMIGQNMRWVAAYRQVYAIGELIDRLFPDPAARGLFERSDENGNVLEQLAHLRAIDRSKASAVEPQRILTIRLPESMHHRLARESDALEISLNRLAISKLLEPALPEHIPSGGKRLGRRCRASSSDPSAERR